MERFLSGVERVSLALWVGGMWVAGYLVAPSLFATLTDRHLAGELAGNIFRLMSYAGLVCGALLLVIALNFARSEWVKTWRIWTLASMLVLVAVGAFVVQPQMVALKAAGIHPGTEQAAQFGRLHGISSVLYLINSLLGLALVVAGIRKTP
jgi:hypothetical protein